MKLFHFSQSNGAFLNFTEFGYIDVENSDGFKALFAQQVEAIRSAGWNPLAHLSISIDRIVRANL